MTQKQIKPFAAENMRHRKLWELIQDAIIIINYDGRIVFTNAQAERMFGYAANDLDYQSMLLILPKDISFVLAGYDSTPQPNGDHSTSSALTPEPACRESWGRRRNGSEFPIEVSISPLQTQSGNENLLIIRDISKRRQVATELHLQGTALEATAPGLAAPGLAALEAAANAIVMTDNGGTITWVNPAFTRLTGYSGREVIGQNPRLLRSGMHDQPLYKNLWDTITAGKVWHGEMTNRRKDGSFYTEEQTITPVRNTQGEITHFIAIKQDITDRKNAEEALWKHAERRAALHKASQEISASLDKNQLFAAIHRAADHMMPCEAFGISLLDKGHKKIEDVYWIDQKGRRRGGRYPVRSGFRGRVIDTGKSLRIYAQAADAAEFDDLSKEVYSLLAVPLRLGEKVLGLLCIQSYSPYNYSVDDQEVLELLASQAAIALENARLFTEMQQMAITDPLTGLHNRRHFFNLARRELERARRYHHPLSIIMLDIDHFKEVNDTLGHAAGDQLLRMIAAHCRETIRDADILGRYGGDEFAILLPETDETSALLVGERICQHISELIIETDKGNIQSTVSLGTATLDESCTDLDMLLDRADKALYTAKEGDRNRIAGWEE
ncbi:MAG: diguanylate cyclase [Chloroflexi bacterium]|nr:diguanylate cyclase [Chloroflexota bacterium]